MPALIRILSLFLFFSSAAQAQDKSAADISVQLGHSSSVNAVAFTPNGRMLVTGSSDQSVKLWDIASGRELRSMNQSGKDVHSVAVSPDGRIIASGDSDGTVKLWDADSGRELRSLKGYGTGWPVSVVFSPDGRLLAFTSSSDHTIRLCDVASGNELRKLTGHTRNINAIAFSPDGRTLVSGGVDLTIRFWDTGTGRELRSLAAYKPDAIPMHGILTVAFSPDGRTLASSGDDYVIRFWDVASGREIRSVGEQFGIYALAFMPDGRTLATGGLGYAVKFWDVASGRELQDRRASLPELYRQTGYFIKSLAISPDGRTVATGGADKMLRLWDTASGRELRAFSGQSKPVKATAYAPDGLTLASAGEDNIIRIRETASGRVKHVLKGHGKGVHEGVTALAYSPDGRLLVSGGEDFKVKLWDTASGRELQTLSGHEHLINAVAVSADGRTLASASLDKNVKLWDIASGRELRTLTGHSKNVSGVAFSPDGRTLISASSDKTIRFWEVDSGRSLRILNNDPYGEIFSLIAFSPDGRTLATAGIALRLWDVESGRPLYLGVDGFTYALAFSPDGRMLASANRDKTIKLREMPSGKELRTLTGHDGAVNGIAFSPDGRKLISASSDTTTRLWDVASGEQKASFVAFNDGSTITITPEGYYDASSEKAEENINVRLGNQVFGIGAYREKFYRPDLVKLALSGGSLSQMARLDKVKPAPRVELIEVPPTANKPQLQVKLRIADAGGGIGDVRLFLNGAAVVQQASRTLAVQKAGSGSVVQTYTLRLVNGMNRIKAVAFNAQNSMQSNPALAELEASLPKSRPSLYGVVVGIQEFKNPRLKLNFPVADAKLFAETLRQNVGSLFQTVDIKLLTTPQETTRASLIQTLQGMRQKVGPEDLFVFFVASHGTAEEGEYFLITSNVGSISTDRLKADALSQADLKELMANIPATKKLIVIDTCNAGALGDTLQAAFLTRGMSDATAMKILARSVGSTVLSASTSSQEALEGYKKHGLFTYVLAEGLMGKADLDKDGFVSTLELAAYVDAQVPVIAEKVFNHPQYPVVSPSGQGFPLVKVK